jgi:GlpG protein
MIGSLDSSQHAKRLGAYLLTEGIKSRMEEEGSQWEVWIMDEDQLESSKDMLAQFRLEPDHERYRTALTRAESIQRAEEKKRKQIQKNLNVGVQATQKKAPVTMTLIVLSGIMALLTGFGNDNLRTAPAMQATTYTFLKPAETLKLLEGLGEDPLKRPSASFFEDHRVRQASIMKGQVWRLITPIFIHFGPLHLVFNMIWLFQLGRLIENRYGSFYLGMLVLFTAAVSNFAQCAVPESFDGSTPSILSGNLVMPLGGMSGVVFGLLGFVWVKSSMDPKSRMFISQTTVLIMLGYLFFCMMPIAEQTVFNNVANWAHGVGLLVGMVVGFIMTQIGK